MGLLKRLVIAIEKIADKKDDYTELNKTISNILREQRKTSIILQQENRRSNVYDRYMWLKSKEKQGKPLEDSELHEIEIGNEMFPDAKR